MKKPIRGKNPQPLPPPPSIPWLTAECEDGNCEECDEDLHVQNYTCECTCHKRKKNEGVLFTHDD